MFNTHVTTLEGGGGRLKGTGLLVFFPLLPCTVVVHCTASKEVVSHVCVKADPENQHYFVRRLTP